MPFSFDEFKRNQQLAQRQWTCPRHEVPTVLMIATSPSENGPGHLINVCPVCSNIEPGKPEELTMVYVRNIN